MALAGWVAIPLALQYAQTHLQSNHVIGTQACPPRGRLGHITTWYCDTFQVCKCLEYLMHVPFSWQQEVR